MTEVILVVDESGPPVLSDEEWTARFIKILYNRFIDAGGSMERSMEFAVLAGGMAIANRQSRVVS